MDESQLRTIEQIEQFLNASTEVAFTTHGGDVERYAHISRVCRRRLNIDPPGVRRKTWTGLCRKSNALPVFQGTE